MKKRANITKAGFLLVQFFMLVYFLINPNNYNKITAILWLILNCIGLFIVAFAVLNAPYNKKNKLIIFGIFCVSIISITLILLFAAIEYIAYSM